VEPARREARAVIVDRLAHELAELDPLALELDLAARDPRDVEQVVDQPRHVRDLALDDRARVDRLLAVRLDVIEDEQAAADRAEWVAQLVREHREEIVLAAARLAQRLLGARELRLARCSVMS
jgi:hypothetical protein